jgi:xylose isomerase
MSTICIGKREYFPNIQKIQYNGPQSKNPLAFRYYDENRKVRGKTMKEHLRFSVAYWHTFGDAGEDPFGNRTKLFPWGENPDEMATAKERLDAAFEFMTKLGVPFYCFHDRDLAPKGRIADRILTESDSLNLKKARYSTFDQGHGAEYEKNRLSLQNLRDIAADLGEPALKSEKQEFYECLVNQYL